VFLYFLNKAATIQSIANPQKGKALVRQTHASAKNIPQTQIVRAEK
jgi:hypothetical protein